MCVFLFSLFVCTQLFFVLYDFSTCLVLVRDMDRCGCSDSPPTMSTFFIFLLISIRGFLKLPYLVAFFSVVVCVHLAGFIFGLFYFVYLFRTLYETDL